MGSTSGVPSMARPRPEGEGDELARVLRPAWADVDLDALAANYRHLTASLGDAGVAAVVKADAYGHGAPEVAHRLEELGASLLAVALLEEAAELRRAGVAAPILALGPAAPAQRPYYRRYRVVPTISSLEQLEMWRAWAAELPPAERQPCHLKVETGMARLGVSVDEVPRALDVLRTEPGLELVGLLSHFAEAEDLASERNAFQEDRFLRVAGLLSEAERQRVAVHLANSAAALHRPSSRLDLVRLGLALYGLDPAAGAVQRTGLEPVMSVRASVVQVRTVAAGQAVSYGGRWTARRESRIGVVPVGYADGYPWGLTGKAEVLVGGRRLPVVGAVTMDMTLVDATDLQEGGKDSELRAGTEVVLLGRQNDEEIDAWELAERAGTLPYEVLCRLGQRLPRRYRL